MSDSCSRGGGALPRTRAPRAGRARRWALAAVALLVLLRGAGGEHLEKYSLALAEAGDCMGLTSWAAGDCRVPAGHDIPTVHLTIKDSTGTPCCGDSLLTVSAELAHGGAPVALRGFTARDSVPGGTGSALALAFSGLRPANAALVGRYNLTFSAFFAGQALALPDLRLLVTPDALRVLPPWPAQGWPDPGPATLADPGPYAVRDTLPPLDVALYAGGAPAQGVADSLEVGVRLLRARDLRDVSGASLLGAARQPLVAGVARFEGLSVERDSGAMHLVFFLAGSERQCHETTPRHVCLQLEALRGPAGGLGGYEVEHIGANITIVPDLLQLSNFAARPVLLRVDETLPGVRVALADSAAPGTPLTGIRAVDGLTVRARLLSGAGEDVTAAALAGTVTQPIAGGVASFGDLVVRGTAGPGFEVRFEPSWRARCNSRLVDPNCEGVCCAATDPFAVFPYAVKLEPPTLPSAAEGAPLGEVRVQLVDYAGALLSGIGPASQFAVKAYLTRQGEFLHAFLAGAASAPVDGGVAAFTDLAVTGYAGSGLSVRFEEAGTRIAEALVPFKVFPAKLAVDSPPPPHVVAGAALADAAVSLRAAAGGVLASVAAADGYDVAVRAVKWVDGAWAECSGCLAGEAAARVRTPDAGRAAFDGGALRVAARVGRFALRFALARDQLAPVEADSAPFGVAPAALELDASLAEAYFVDEELPECQVALLDADGAPMAGVALADGANVTVAVVWPGRAAPPPAARLRGRAWALADGGYANFANLSVAGAAGVGAQLLFEYVDAVTGARLNASSERFSVAPARLAFPGLPPHATAGVVLPPRAVLAQDEAGAPLALDAAHDALALTAALAAYAPLNESDAPPRGAAPRDLAWDPDASAAECEARAAAAGAAYFALAEPPRAFGCAFGGTRCAAGDAKACAEADADGGFAEDCAAAGRAAAAAAEAGVTLGEEGLAVDAVGAFCAAATGAGEAPCLFPFLHGGVNHSQCITDGNDGVPWCATHRGGPVLGRGNCSCVGGCASSFRYSALELLGAPARLAGANATLNGTAARFSALRIEGVFGSRAARLRFESAVGALPPVAVLSAPLSVDPARLVPTNLLGRRTPASAPLPVSVAFGDGDADLLAPLPRSGAYAVAAALRLGDTDLTQHLVGGAPAAVLGGRAAWNLSFPTAAARGARLHFSTALENGTALRAASRAFFVLPDALAVEYNASVGLAGVAGRDLPAVVVSGRAADGATIPCFGYTFVLALINGSSGEPVPACATGWSHPAGCVSGTFEQPADSGTARFADVRPVNVTGVGFVLRVALRGENVSADSPAFDVFPGDLRIVAGRTDFTGDYLILNRAVERYAVRFLASQGGAPLAQVPRARFNVSVSLVRDPPAGAAGAAPPGDVSHRLAGTRWHLAAWDAAGGAHVAFTDLEVLAAGADLRLKFRLEDELSTMSVATGRFRAVPHALRVAQDCYNGARVNASAPIPQGFPPLECVAPNPDATAALGVFGHLAGFYYYANNAYVGPLLRNVRGAAPVPPVTVLLTDLAGETQAHLDARDGAQLAVGVQLFLEGASQPRSAALRGTTQRAAEGGAAHFDDLVVGRVEGCGVSCRLELRFVVFGAVCVDSWCASLRLGVANAPLVPPHRLGSHPAFPGGAAVVGALALALDADALSDNDAAVFRKGLARLVAGAPGLSAADVEITGTAASAAPGAAQLEVRFRVRAASFAASDAVVASLSAALGAPRDSALAGGCEASELGAQGLPICAAEAALAGPLERDVSVPMVDTRAGAPTFAPNGSSAACAAAGQGRSACPLLGGGPFLGFNLSVAAGENATAYLTADGCPLDAVAGGPCGADGSVPSDTALALPGGGEARLFETAPTRTLLPAGREEQALSLPALDGAALIGARHAGAIPRAVTVRAYAAEPGRRDSLLAEATYALLPQAAAPTLDADGLAWCDATNVFDPALLSQPAAHNGAGCGALPASALLCAAAERAPCVAPDGAVCTSGSLRSLARDGAYDGGRAAAGAVTLVAPYTAGALALRVTDARALGFEAGGNLSAPVALRVGANGAGTEGAAPALRVAAVDLERNVLTLAFASAQAAAAAVDAAVSEDVAVAEACAPQQSLRVLRAPLRAGAAPAPGGAAPMLVYTVDGSSPRADSPRLAAGAGAGNVSVLLPALPCDGDACARTLTAVAVADGALDSFPLEISANASGHEFT